MWKNQEGHYGWGAQILHWLMVPLLLGLMALGVWMTGLTYFDPWYHRSVNLHRALGVVAFVLALVRLAWRFYDAPPALPETLASWERRAAQATHFLLYLLMVLLPVSGYLVSTADGRPVDVFGWFKIPALPWRFANQETVCGWIHLGLAVSLGGLILLHVSGALKHQWMDKDNTLSRMLPVKQQTLSPPSEERNPS